MSRKSLTSLKLADTYLGFITYCNWSIHLKYKMNENIKSFPKSIWIDFYLQTSPLFVKAGYWTP